jgi:hypothetical protein
MPEQQTALWAGARRHRRRTRGEPAIALASSYRRRSAAVGNKPGSVRQTWAQRVALSATAWRVVHVP